MKRGNPCPEQNWRYWTPLFPSDGIIFYYPLLPRLRFPAVLLHENPIVVTAGKTTHLHAGAPFLAELDLFTVEKNKPVLVLNIRDQEGECYYFESFRNVGESKTKLEQPSLRIVDQEGREVAQGGFENNRRFVWQVPDTLKGEFTAIPEVHVGPFPIKMVPKVIHLK